MKLDVETKFNIGDKVKRYANGEICTIKDIYIDINEHAIRNIYYHIVNEQNKTDSCLSGCLLEEVHILDKQEHDYLRAVCKPYKVKCIRKTETSLLGEQFIEIVVKSSSCCGLTAELSMPYFTKDTMYKGMEVNKKYTVEELELDKEWKNNGTI